VRTAAGVFVPITPGLRLTTESGVPVSTSDRTAQATIYYTAFVHSWVPLWTGINWENVKLTAQLSLALSSLTSGKNYDVFAYKSGVTAALELSAAWTTDTARADAVTQQDGYWVKSSTKTRLLIGTIRTTGTTTTEDSGAKRFVWNRYNRVLRPMKNAAETANSWTYGTANTMRQANSNAANQLDYVVGDNDLFVDAAVAASAFNSSGTVVLGVGVDSTSVQSAQAYPLSNPVSPDVLVALYRGYPGIGRHFLAWLEGQASGTTTFYGDNNSTMFQTGMSGGVWG
jgi:hypothetical protein